MVGDIFVDLGQELLELDCNTFADTEGAEQVKINIRCAFRGYLTCHQLRCDVLANYCGHVVTAFTKASFAINSYGFQTSAWGSSIVLETNVRSFGVSEVVNPALMRH